MRAALVLIVLLSIASSVQACGEDSSTTSSDAANTDLDGAQNDGAGDLPASDSDADDPLEDSVADAVADSSPDPDVGADVEPCRGRVVGTVTDLTRAGAPLEGARVTLEAVSGGGVLEVRSAADGRFELAAGPATYRLGASRLGLAYVEQEVVVSGGCPDVPLALGAETHGGVWRSLGDPGEAFGGTNSGVLLPDGRVMFCHDTLDPVLFDPSANAENRFTPAAESPRLQGCHAVTVLADGRVMYVGGTDQPVYGPGTRQVKLYDPVENEWTAMTEPNLLVDPRWYPSLAPLPGGGYLAIGGGGLDNPLRLDTSEVLDPDTLEWRSVGDVALGNEVSPVVLLFTGEVLMTHRPPQLYDPELESWRLAGDFVQGNRMANGDHADHELVMLADGRVVAVGFKSFEDGEAGRMLEIYTPEEDRWDLGAAVAPVRSRASVLLLPDQRVLVMGGQKEDPTDPTPINTWGQVALTDQYDPATDAWRRLSEMGLAREYHAMPVLLPDGRVVIVGGEGLPGNEPPASVVEVFEPPYLFRGPRPRLEGLETTRFTPGDTLRFRVTGTSRPTGVALVGAVATTHFMDSGPGRYLDLGFSVDGDQVTATLPTAPARAIPGHYILFVLVDDIPSAGVLVRVAR